MATTVAETRVAESFGGIARDKNTARLWVPPSRIATLSVTGVWALEVNSNVPSLATDDAGGASERLYIPCEVEFSDFIQRGTTNVDRGVQLIALELIYEVAASALAGFDLDIWKVTYDAEGTGTAAEMTTTLTFDTAGDTGVEIDQHRALATINARDREWWDGGKTFFGEIDIADGTASDVNILGAIWHYRRLYE